MGLGEKLKSLRLRTNKTLKEQSELFRVSINSVYRWEHNLAIPRKSILKEMAEHYSVPFEWLLLESVKDESYDHEPHHSSNIEQQLLNAFKKLSDNNKYKVLGYIERMFIEESRVDTIA